MAESTPADGAANFEEHTARYFAERGWDYDQTEIDKTLKSLETRKPTPTSDDELPEGFARMSEHPAQSPLAPDRSSPAIEALSAFPRVRERLERRWGDELDERMEQAWGAAALIESTEVTDQFERQVGAIGLIELASGLGRGIEAIKAANGGKAPSPREARSQLRQLKMNSDFVDRYVDGDEDANDLVTALVFAIDGHLE